jgi:hypothetical protein
MYILAMWIFSNVALAALPGMDCPDTQAVVGKTVVNEFFTIADGCTLWITPQDKPNLLYREYFFDERGRFRIYDSTPGDYETASGSRAYFLFPRKQLPTFTVSADKNEVIATLGSGGTIRFRTDTTRISAFPGVAFSESPDIRLDNQGGVEILSYPGILLDTGWKLGGVGYTDSVAKATFRDGKGHACVVTNNEIFDYKDAIYDEPLFMFQTDPELKEFLSKRCPELDRNGL